MSGFAYKPTDPWSWYPATDTDIPEIVDLIIMNYHEDGSTVWSINPVEGTRNLSHAVINQMYAPQSELLLVARSHRDAKVIAFTWLVRDHRQWWSTDEQAQARMLSIDLAQSNRTKVGLCVQAMQAWETWACACHIPIIASNSLRYDWQPLIRLHERMGYETRGNLAWKRLTPLKETI
jgi:hypothetical protein